MRVRDSMSVEYIDYCPTHEWQTFVDGVCPVGSCDFFTGVPLAGPDSINYALFAKFINDKDYRWAFPMPKHVDRHVEWLEAIKEVQLFGSEYSL
jgi:hypothetical protein